MPGTMYATPARNIIPMRENERCLIVSEKEGRKEAPNRKRNTYTEEEGGPR